jgi:NAD(P)-dependent dehydrogenase (short-subunit alcohol dehydrogenase family)
MTRFKAGRPIKASLSTASSILRIFTSDLDRRAVPGLLDVGYGHHAKSPGLMPKGPLRSTRKRRGAIVNISSVAAHENTYPLVAYKATKAAMIAFTEQLALHNAPYGIRANCILPGLMDTPMAFDTSARAGNRSRAEVAAERDARVPLRGKMGTGWDVANAALFLALDEANFITGVALPVDRGALVKVG